MHIKPNDSVSTWHKDVQFFDIFDESQELRGRFYLDLFARNKKRGGAWMDDAVGRRILINNSVQIPVAYLTCNFQPPENNKPALLSHDEVVTLFHEFGHGLHHMLTQINSLDVAGINGVPWDAVELPSQFFENWCWQEESLKLISGHYETHAPVPQQELEQLQKAKNFQAGMFLVRQIEFSLFDMRLHMEPSITDIKDVQKLLDSIREEVSVVPKAEYNRFAHAFSHIFAGGYAAGYYSYLWAEVLSCDAFSRFEEEGIFNAQTGRDFLHCILEQGGSKEPEELFIEFRGRKPQIDALLRHHGLE